MTVIYAVLVFGLIIFVHELGHFIAAKAAGITVYEFTIGFGPAIIKKQIGETLYAIRLLPVGGAVVMKDENEEPPESVLPEQVSSDEGCFQKASWLQRFSVVVAGSFMNFVTGVLLILLVMLPASHVAQPVISEFAEGFPLEDTLHVGDRLLKINDFRIFTYGDVSMALQLAAEEPFDLTIERNGEKILLEDVPLERRDYDGNGQLRYGLSFGYEEISGLNKVKYAVNNAFSFFQSAYKSIGLLIGGQAKTSDLMGTIGIASEISNRAEQSMGEMWYFVAYISINLSFVNMLPIPGLDGGKLFFMLIELIIGRKLDPKWENYCSYIGLFLVLLLFVFATYNDILRLIRA